MTLSPAPKALLFDVFGTCVNWRQTVVGALHAQAHAALNSATASMASRVRLRVSDMTLEHWGTFAQQWRQSYMKFTRSVAADASAPWKSVDEHHLEALKELMAQWEIEGLWSEKEILALSMIWHHLVPWEDSVRGVELLNRSFETCTLSNGNISLLSDLRDFSKIPFTQLFSAEMFGTYKPSPRVYLGAAEKLRLAPEQCAMVAAHLNDLQAAKQNGLRTVYVERPGEEAWSKEEVEKAKRDGWVDVWVGLEGGSQGFITVAERLGVDADDS